MARTRLPPSLAKRFRTGRVCPDFAHTGGSGDWVEPELVQDTATLERWLAHVLSVEQVRAQPEDLATAYRLREAVWQLARVRTGRSHVTADPVETVNAVAAAAPPVLQMTADGRVAPVTASGTAALSAIARDAVDLLTGPLGDRIRVCAAEDCAFLFVDSSRTGTRRWCSMARCGNLTKVRHHRARRSASSEVRSPSSP